MQSLTRSRWAAIGAAVAVTLGGGISLVSAASSDGASTLVPIEPCRLADTRPAFTVGNKNTPLGENETLTLATHGDNGQCTGIPTTATGLALNVTGIDATRPTFLTIWGAGNLPNASHLNPVPGQPPTPNAVTTGLTSAGAVNVFNRFGNVHIIVDVVGYYTTSTLQELSQRLAALEAAQAAGVARIAALETTTATNIAALDLAQPFAVTNRDDTEGVTSTDEVVVSVAVTAPVAGQVTVNSTTTAIESTDGDYVRCSITTDTTHDFDYQQNWEGGPGSYSQLAGTRTFNIAASATVSYNLVCDHNGTSGDGTTLADAVLTAIFTPAR